MDGPIMATRCLAMHWFGLKWPPSQSRYNKGGLSLISDMNFQSWATWAAQGNKGNFFCYELLPLLGVIFSCFNVIWLIYRHRQVVLPRELHLPENHFSKKPYFYHYYFCDFYVLENGKISQRSRHFRKLKLCMVNNSDTSKSFS